MADKSVYRPLIKIGPAKGIDSSTADEFIAAGDGNVVSNVDTNRITGALTNALGRHTLITFPSGLGNFFTNNPGAVINAIAPVYATTGVEVYLCSLTGGTVNSMGWYRPGFSGDLGAITSPVTAYWDQAVQFNGTMYMNSGYQWNFVDDPNAAVIWQWPAPNNPGTSTPTNTNQTMIGLTGGIIAAWPQQYYAYAFTLVVTPPGGNPQETSAVGADDVYSWSSYTIAGAPTYPAAGYSPGTSQLPYPYQYYPPGGTPLTFPPTEVTTKVAAISPNLTVTLNGIITTLTAWSGTLPDGSAYSTNVYRISSAQPIWYFVQNLTGTLPFDDGYPDNLIAGNQILQQYQDPPPLSPTQETSIAPGLGAIFIHQERMWVFSNVYAQLPVFDELNYPYTPAPTLNYQWQSQLWWSNLGTPWLFNSTEQAVLVGNSATVQSEPNYSAGFGDYPVAGVSLGSLAVLFKSQTTWGLFGNATDTYVVTKLFDIGCQSRHSVISYLGVVYWLSAAGIYAFNGGAPQYLSQKIRNTLNAIPASVQATCYALADNLSVHFVFPGYFTLSYYTVDGTWTQKPYSAACGFSGPSNTPPASGSTNAFGEVVCPRVITGSAPALDAWFFGEKDLGLAITGTWTSPLTTSGEGNFENVYEYITFYIPNYDDVGNLQTGSVTWTLTLNQGSTTPQVFGSTFNVGSYQGGQQSPRYIFRIGSNPIPNAGPPANDFKGFDAILSVSFTNSLGGTKSANTKLFIQKIVVWGYPDRMLVIPD